MYPRLRLDTAFSRLTPATQGNGMIRKANSTVRLDDDTRARVGRLAAG